MFCETDQQYSTFCRNIFYWNRTSKGFVSLLELKDDKATNITQNEKHTSLNVAVQTEVSETKLNYDLQFSVCLNESFDTLQVNVKAIVWFFKIHLKLVFRGHFCTTFVLCPLFNAICLSII